MALEVRNFRLWFVGQFISVVGNWMQMVVVPVLVLDKMDRGGTVLGIVVAMLYVPVMVFGPWGGVVSDRFPKRRIVIATQLAFTVAVGSLGLLVVTDHLTLWAVMLLASVQGAINAFDNPARQTFVHEMVGPDLLTNVVGLNMLEMNTARVIGPAIASARGHERGHAVPPQRALFLGAVGGVGADAHERVETHAAPTRRARTDPQRHALRARPPHVARGDHDARARRHVRLQLPGGLPAACEDHLPPAEAP